MKNISIWDIFVSIYLRKELFIIVVALFVVSAIIYIIITKPIYNPTSVVKANVYESVPTWVADLLQQRLVPSTPVDRMASQVELIKVITPNILKNNGVNLEFKLPKKYVEVIERKTIIDTIMKKTTFKVVLKPESIFVYRKDTLMCKGTYRQEINCILFSFSLSKLKNFEKPIKGEIIYKNFPLTIDKWMKDKVKINQIGISDLIRITVEDEDAYYAKRIANRIAQAYIDYSLDEEKRLARETRERLEPFYEQASKIADSLKEIIKVLKADTIALVPYMLDFGLGSEAMAKIVERYFADQSSRNIENLEKVSRQYTSKSLALEEIGSIYNSAVSQRNSLRSLLEQTKLVEAKTVSVAKILSEARIPPKPKWPKKGIILVISTFLGLIFATIAVIIADRIDRKIITPLKLKMILTDNNAKVFYTISGLKSYIALNNIEKISSNVKIDGFETTSPDEADIYVVVLDKNMGQEELIKLVKDAKNKEKLFLIKML